MSHCITLIADTGHQVWRVELCSPDGVYPYQPIGHKTQKLWENPIFVPNPNIPRRDLADGYRQLFLICRSHAYQVTFVSPDDRMFDIGHRTFPAGVKGKTDFNAFQNKIENFAREHGVRVLKGRYCFLKSCYWRARASFGAQCRWEDAYCTAYPIDICVDGRSARGVLIKDCACLFIMERNSIVLEMIREQRSVYVAQFELTREHPLQFGVQPYFVPLDSNHGGACKPRCVIVFIACVSNNEVVQQHLFIESSDQLGRTELAGKDSVGLTDRHGQQATLTLDAEAGRECGPGRSAEPSTLAVEVSNPGYSIPIVYHTDADKSELAIQTSASPAVTVNTHVILPPPTLKGANKLPVTLAPPPRAKDSGPPPGVAAVKTEVQAETKAEADSSTKAEPGSPDAQFTYDEYAATVVEPASEIVGVQCSILIALRFHILLC